MAAVHDYGRAAVLKAASRDSFRETFTAPFAIVFAWFAPRDEGEPAKEIVNSHLDRIGLPPVRLAPDAGSVTLAWCDVTQDFWRALEQVERDHVSPIHTGNQQVRRQAGGQNTGT